jgi:hypothetical protein
MKKALELETLEKGFSALAHIQKLEQQIKELKDLLSEAEPKDYLTLDSRIEWLERRDNLTKH